MNSILLLSKNSLRYLIIIFCTLVVAITLPVSAAFIRSSDRSAANDSSDKISALGGLNQPENLNPNDNSDNNSPENSNQSASDSDPNPETSTTESSATAQAETAPTPERIAAPEQGTTNNSPASTPANSPNTDANQPPAAPQPVAASSQPAQAQVINPAPATSVINGSTITLDDASVSTSDAPQADPTFDPAHNLTQRPELGYIPGIGPNPAQDTSGPLLAPQL